MLSWAARAPHGIIRRSANHRKEKMQDGRRERFLSPERPRGREAVGDHDAVGDDGFVGRTPALRSEHVDAFRLLAVTGVRRGEILGLRWDEIDLERAILTLKPNRHKAGAKGRGRVISRIGRPSTRCAAASGRCCHALPSRSRGFFPNRTAPGLSNRQRMPGGRSGTRPAYQICASMICATPTHPCSCKEAPRSRLLAGPLATRRQPLLNAMLT